MKRDVKLPTIIKSTPVERYGKLVPLTPSMAKRILARAQHRGRYLPLHVEQALKMIAAREWLNG